MYRQLRAGVWLAALALVAALVTACSGGSGSRGCALQWKAGATLPADYGQCLFGFGTGIKTTKYQCHGPVDVVVVHWPHMWAVPGQSIHLVSGEPIWRNPEFQHVMSKCEVPTDF